MRLRYDDDFLEAATFLCAGGRRPGAALAQLGRFHADRERCYAVSDPDERNGAFFKAHLHWFREWGLEGLLTGLIEEQPLLSGALDVLAFRQARARNEEGAELYVSGEGVRNAMVALRMDRLERDEPMRRFLRHEFTHLSDMIDPSYSYSPQLDLPGLNPTQRRILLDRYRLLWDITIDGRLTRAGHETVNRLEQHRALFDRAFSFWSEQKRRQVFESYWNDPAPRHAAILALAADPRDLSHAQAPLPGGSCPLCLFPTFDWADVTAVAADVLSALRDQFPGWTRDQGVCRRCIEVYEMAGKHEMPATVCV